MMTDVYNHEFSLCFISFSCISRDSIVPNYYGHKATLNCGNRKAQQMKRLISFRNSNSGGSMDFLQKLRVIFKNLPEE